MSRLTIFDHNRSKILYRLKHHPDCKDATHYEHRDGESLIVVAKNGTLIRVHDDVDWLRGEDGEPSSTSAERIGAVGLLSCLLDAHRTVDTEEEMVDLVCELYRTKSLKSWELSYAELLKVAFMWLGLGLDHKIGHYRDKALHRVVPKALKGKCGYQLTSWIAEGMWEYGSLTWWPLRDLVAQMCQEDYFDGLWKAAGPVESARKILFDHYQKHGKLATRHAIELQRRVTALDGEGQFPEVA